MNEKERLHIDLFSGIGGFALACRANGIRTIQFCESDPKCQAFLKKAWPGVPIHGDIRTFHWGVADAAGVRRQDTAQKPGGDAEVEGETECGCGFAKYARPVWLLTAGVPCQPASRAGKQRGKEDDRWLWEDAVRVLSEVRPTWALFENPPGIGDVGLAGVIASVEDCGYEVRVFDIPACAVGAAHRRARYWIVAHTNEVRRQGADTESGADGLCAEHSQGDLADASCERTGESRDERGEGEGQGTIRGSCGTFWFRSVLLPCADGKFRRAPDDSFGLVDGLHRSVLAALGNSIVPQVAAKVIEAIVKAEVGA